MRSEEEISRLNAYSSLCVVTEKHLAFVTLKLPSMIDEEVLEQLQKSVRFFL